MNHSELVLARNAVKAQITDKMDKLTWLKGAIAEAWSQASKDNLNGNVWFHHLNRLKDSRRRTLKELKTLEALSRHLRMEIQCRIMLDEMTRQDLRDAWYFPIFMEE